MRRYFIKIRFGQICSELTVRLCKKWECEGRPGGAPSVWYNLEWGNMDGTVYLFPCSPSPSMGEGRGEGGKGLCQIGALLFLAMSFCMWMRGQKCSVKTEDGCSISCEYLRDGPWWRFTTGLRMAMRALLQKWWGRATSFLFKAAPFVSRPVIGMHFRFFFLISACVLTLFGWMCTLVMNSGAQNISFLFFGDTYNSQREGKGTRWKGRRSLGGKTRRSEMLENPLCCTRQRYIACYSSSFLVLFRSTGLEHLQTNIYIYMGI